MFFCWMCNWILCLLKFIWIAEMINTVNPKSEIWNFEKKKSNEFEWSRWEYSHWELHILIYKTVYKKWMKRIRNSNGSMRIVSNYIYVMHLELTFMARNVL